MPVDIGCERVRHYFIWLMVESSDESLQEGFRIRQGISGLPERIFGS